MYASTGTAFSRQANSSASRLPDTPVCPPWPGQDQRWYALQVRCNSEWGVARNLHANGFEPFLPIYKKTCYWSDRTKIIAFPLFPGYLFCRFDVARRLQILKASGVVSIVGVARQPAPIDEGEINAIRAVVQAGQNYEPYPYIAEGQQVRITGGALMGLTGVVIHTHNALRFVISVELLMRSVAVEIDSALVEPVS